MAEALGANHVTLELPSGPNAVAVGHGRNANKEILQLVRRNRWTFPASIEQEYQIPEGSDAVKEVKKCVELSEAGGRRAPT